MNKRIILIRYFLPLICCCLFILFPFTGGQAQRISITLTWSTDVYVPTNYPGKALPSQESMIEVVANIDWLTGQLETNLQELNYQWFLDGQLQKKDSGQDKQIFRFKTSQSLNQQYLIKVLIRDNQNNFLGYSPLLSLKTAEPEVVLKTDIFPRKLSRLTSQYQIKANQEVKFTAQPYFFNIQNLNELNYQWNWGEKELSQTGNEHPNVVIIKVGQVGQSIEEDLTINLENKNNSLQDAQTKAEINLIP